MSLWSFSFWRLRAGSPLMHALPTRMGFAPGRGVRARSGEVQGVAERQPVRCQPHGGARAVLPFHGRIRQTATIGQWPASDDRGNPDLAVLEGRHPGRPGQDGRRADPFHLRALPTSPKQMPRPDMGLAGKMRLFRRAGRARPLRVMRRASSSSAESTKAILSLAQLSDELGDHRGARDGITSLRLKSHSADPHVQLSAAGWLARTGVSPRRKSMRRSALSSRP